MQHRLARSLLALLFVAPALVVAGCPAAETLSSDAGGGNDAASDAGSTPDGGPDGGGAGDGGGSDGGGTDAGPCARPDQDGDGHRAVSCGGDDCDDADPQRFPGNTEVCDATHDEDCAPSTVGTRDSDHDGFVDAMCCNVVSGMTTCGDDCDDAAPTIHPTQAETCDGLDEDCDTAIDEGLTVAGYLPDCDADGYGAATASPVNRCGPPAMAPACASGTGGWVTTGGDCNDAQAGINPGNPDICNGIDDNCNGMIDDIVRGTVVCAAGQTRPCTTGCGGAGTAACSASCLGWDTCRAPEICNGCDDDGDSAIDNGFTCPRSGMRSCTTACGTTGLQSCDAMCSAWNTCAAIAETCNYCDDNLLNGLTDDRALATSSSTRYVDCSPLGPAARCDAVPLANPSDFDLWATILDGTAVPQAGAIWLDPASWVQGYGPTTVDVTLEVTAVTAGRSFEMPLGGWAVVIAHAGTIGVGAANALGVPGDTAGAGVHWFWSTFDRTSSFPPSANDSIRGFGPGELMASETGAGWSNTNGDNLMGGSPSFDGVGSGTMTQRMVLTYQPDDPTTGANEELLTVTATPNGSSTTTTYHYHPSGANPVGTSTLRVGITAGTYTQSGFSGPPPGSTFGVPVRARVRIFTQTMMNRAGLPPLVTITQRVPVTTSGLCP
jgi:hypothetical protein